MEELRLAERKKDVDMCYRVICSYFDKNVSFFISREGDLAFHSIFFEKFLTSDNLPDQKSVIENLENDELEELQNSLLLVFGYMTDQIKVAKIKEAEKVKTGKIENQKQKSKNKIKKLIDGIKKKWLEFPERNKSNFFKEIYEKPLKNSKKLLDMVNTELEKRKID